MPTASCHCGAVSLDPAEAATTVTDCNCSICRRYGVPWAYCSPTQVTIVPSDAVLDGYQWSDRSITFNRCRQCGCVAHGSTVDLAVDRMGVDARHLPPDILDRARVRHFDGARIEEYVD